MAANATFALKAGVWFRRARLVMLSPDPRQSAPPSGRKSTYPAVQFPQASSPEMVLLMRASGEVAFFRSNDHGPDQDDPRASQRRHVLPRAPHRSAVVPT